MSSANTLRVETPPKGPPSAEEAGPPRERILAAARDLFYRNGIRAVGVDAIAEAAATNKMTLYRHFASKDLLVAECLRRWAAEMDAAWNANARAHAGRPREQLEAWLRHVAEFKLDMAERGCAFNNAVAELPEKDHPARRVVEEHKRQNREKFIGLCREADLADPELLADELFLLCEGARLSVQSVGREGPAKRLADMLQGLIASHSKPRRK